MTTSQQMSRVGHASCLSAALDLIMAMGLFTVGLGVANAATYYVDFDGGAEGRPNGYIGFVKLGRCLCEIERQQKSSRILRTGHPKQNKNNEHGGK